MQSQPLREGIAAMPGVVAVPLSADTFFFYDPDNIGEKARRFPMATLITSDAYDSHSGLGREGVFRLNFGVDKQTFDGLFAGKATAPDYARRDVLMPHPEYAAFHFVCVLNPERTLRQVRGLLAIAHREAMRRDPAIKRK